MSASSDGTRELLINEAWSIIEQARTKGELAVASATLERAARIAGVWSDKSVIDPSGRAATQVFTSEPLSAEEWSEKFAPKE